MHQYRPMFFMQIRGAQKNAPPLYTLVPRKVLYTVLNRFLKGTFISSLFIEI